MIEVQSSITHKMKEDHHIMGCGAWFQGSWTHILRDICKKCFESMKSLEMFWRQYVKCFRLLLLQLCRLFPIWKRGSTLFVADGYEIADRINIGRIFQSTTNAYGQVYGQILQKNRVWWEQYSQGVDLLVDD